jgi:site-specific DNA-methyltransferase (adenine-specific)/modification methylase
MVASVTWGDAIEELRLIDDERFDLVVTDPPYNISTDSVLTRRGRTKPLVHDMGEWDHDVVMPGAWVPNACRILKPNGVFISFYAKERLGEIIDLLSKADFTFRHIGAWVKTNPPPQLRGQKWMNGLELFVVATKNSGSGHHFNSKLGQSPEWFQSPICMGSERIKQPHHPTQKPLELARWIISYWSFPGDKVLDPFAGTGTFGVAAKELGRDVILIEQEKKYVDVCWDRLDRAESRPEPMRPTGEAMDYF